MSDELDNKEDAASTESRANSAAVDIPKIVKEEEEYTVDSDKKPKEDAAAVQSATPAYVYTENKSANGSANSEIVKNPEQNAHEEIAKSTKVSPTLRKLNEDTSAKPSTLKPTTEYTAPEKSQIEQSGLEDSENTENLTYTDDGSAIYTDPKTNFQYKWCNETDKWVPLNETYENEFYKWCTKTNQWLPKETSTETEHYKWDAEKGEWVAKELMAATTATVDEDGRRIYTDKDGAVFFWDTEKKAWFPKIDDDFMARYQMNYGFIDNTSAGEAEQRLKAETEEKRKAAELQRMTAEAIKASDMHKKDETPSTATPNGGKRKAKQEPPKWFDLNPEQNTKVYVSNLPLDITLEEFAELMSKCGMIMRDPKTQKYKLKLYSEPDGQLKGDGLCDYIKVESVGLAIKILDEYNYRGHKIHVQRAQFQMRGEYNPALKPKRKKSDKEKLQKIKEKLFDWRPEKMRGERSKNEKIVIIKNLFSPEIFEQEVQLILDYQNDLREECSKCGTVRKVVIYDRHPEGVAQINMSSPEEADVVIQMMHGRFFGKRQLTADHWDGKTKYKIVESEQEVQKRLSNWDKFLTEDEAAAEKRAQSQTAQTIAEQELAEEAALTAQLESEMHAEEDDE